MIFAQCVRAKLILVHWLDAKVPSSLALQLSSNFTAKKCNID